MEITSYTAKNSRSYQEDRFFAKKLTNGEVLLGIFDGHGGHWTAEYAAVHTPNFYRAMRRVIKENPLNALKHLFATLHKKTETHHSGAAACIVLIQNNVAHVGILGDSAVVIKSGTGAIWHSPEHNVRSNAYEADEAMARGAKIYNGYMFDGYQIDGPGLQMSRALGDYELRRVLNREPEIFNIPLNENSWILLCTDGLIDPSHQNTAMLENAIRLIETATTTAETLVVENAKIDKNDNSTAVLVRL